ncbi:hypothetical protein [Enterobacter intestinihominis]
MTAANTRVAATHDPDLTSFYEPMYGYHLEKKAEKIVYRGTFEDIAEWLDR